MAGIRQRLKRLRRATHAPLLRYVTLPLINRELRKGGLVLYRYVAEVDRLVPFERFRRRSFRRHKRGAMDGDHWYRALRERRLEMPVAIDVGVNYGYTSVWLSGWAEQVYAFEPNPDNVARIREQLEIRHARNVELIASAVAAEEGQATLFVKPMDGHHSLGDIGASETIGTLEVPVTTLDAFCRERGVERVGLLKIDVEGFEPDVLAGASGLLGRAAIELILFEYSPAFYRQRGLDSLAPIEVLERFGYRVTQLDGAAIDRSTLAAARQADLLAEPPLR